jgi:hypothetical protein
VLVPKKSERIIKRKFILNENEKKRREMKMRKKIFCERQTQKFPAIDLSESPKKRGEEETKAICVAFFMKKFPAAFA